MIRRPPRSTLSSSSAASDVYKRQEPMDHEALPELIELSDCLLNSEQKEIIERATKEIYDKPDAYELDFFWKFDSSIGGIGGYCMPFNPVVNPFPRGIGRFLFRPLQYAAANIECNKGIY